MKIKMKVTCYLESGDRVSFFCDKFAANRDGSYSYDGMLVDNSVQFMDASKIVAVSSSPAPFLGLVHYVRSAFYAVLTRVCG